MTVSFHSNHSTLFTMNTTNLSMTVFGPPRNRSGLAVMSTAIILVLSVTALVGNILVLAVEIQRNLSHQAITQSLLKRNISGYFLKSLAVSDLLNALVLCPLALLETYSQYSVRSIWACYLGRIPFRILMMTTLFNLVVLTAERYCAVFHPLRCPSAVACRNLVFVAWFLSVIAGIVSVVTMDIDRVYLTKYIYILECKYHANIGWKRALFLTCNTALGLVPAVGNIILACKVSRYLNGRTRRPSYRDKRQLRHNSASQAWRFRNTRMFVRVILSFAMPFSFYFSYHTVKTLTDLQISLTTDRLLRFVALLLTFFNGALNPILYFSGSLELRRRLKCLVTKYCGHRDDVSESQDSVTSYRSNTQNTSTGENEGNMKWGIHKDCHGRECLPKRQWRSRKTASSINATVKGDENTDKIETGKVKMSFVNTGFSEDQYFRRSGDPVETDGCTSTTERASSWGSLQYEMKDMGHNKLVGEQAQLHNGLVWPSCPSPKEVITKF